MDWIDELNQLAALYGGVSTPARQKVSHSLAPLYRKWIAASRLCVLATSGTEGADASPRGDDGPVVLDLDEHRLALPDWRGNNRLDSLRNIIENPNVGLMFITAGCNEVLRVNGTARITEALELRRRFEKKNRLPTTVIVIHIKEIYIHCSRALLRSGLWQRNDKAAVPSMGEILSDMTQGTVDAEKFDAEWPDRAQARLW